MSKFRKIQTDARLAAEGIQLKADGESRGLTDDEQAAFDGHIETGLKAKSDEERELKSRNDLALLGDPELADDEPVVKSADTFTGNGIIQVREAPRETAGDMFLKSAGFTNLIKAHPGGLPSGQSIQMAPASIGELKALVTDPQLSPVTVVNSSVLQVREDMLNAFTIMPDAGTGIKHNTATFTNNAAVVAETTGPGTGVKPESALAWTNYTINPETIAHHIPVTTQALQRNAQLRALIDEFMIDGVVRLVAAEAIAALAAKAGLQAQAYDTDMRTTIRKAVTKASKYGTPNGLVISANDAETLDLEAMSAALVVPGQPYTQTQTIWRLPIFSSHNLPDGVGYVGNLKQVQVYTDGPVRLLTGWVNDQFIRNSLTILAEQDAVTDVMVAPSIVKVDLDPAV